MDSRLSTMVPVSKYTWVGLTDWPEKPNSTVCLCSSAVHGRDEHEGILWIRGVHTEATEDGRALLAAYALSDLEAPLLPISDPRLASAAL